MPKDDDYEDILGRAASIDAVDAADEVNARTVAARTQDAAKDFASVYIASPDQKSLVKLLEAMHTKGILRGEELNTFIRRVMGEGAKDWNSELLDEIGALAAVSTDTKLASSLSTLPPAKMREQVELLAAKVAASKGAVARKAAETLADPNASFPQLQSIFNASSQSTGDVPPVSGAGQTPKPPDVETKLNEVSSVGTKGTTTAGNVAASADDVAKQAAAQAAAQGLSREQATELFNDLIAKANVGQKAVEKTPGIVDKAKDLLGKAGKSNWAGIANKVAGAGVILSTLIAAISQWRQAQQLGQQRQLMPSSEDLFTEGAISSINRDRLLRLAARNPQALAMLQAQQNPTPNASRDRGKRGNSEGMSQLPIDLGALGG